jgi:hypothetical protein
VKVVRNRVAPHFREFEILYGSGASASGEIVDLASEAGLIEKSGVYYSWNCERIAQGRDKARQYLVEHPALAAELRDKLVALRNADNARLEGHRFRLAVERARPRSFGDRSNLGKLGYSPSDIP